MSEKLSLGKDTFTEAANYIALEASLLTEVKSEHTDLSAESIEAVATKFRYRTEIDQDGLTRQIYARGDVSFSFAGREETPIYPAIEQSRPTRLGHEPWRRDSLNNREHYKEEIDRQTNYDPTLATMREANAGKPEHFIAETSPYGIYLLLAKLQPDNPNWQMRANEIAQGQYNDETLKTIDMATALNAFYLQNGEAALHEPMPGELVVVVALLGDTDAQNIANQAVELQRQREQAAVDRNKTAADSRESLTDDTEAFKPSDLVVVHATHYEPREVDDGYEVVTTHDASGFPRATIHTSLNHKVENAGMNGEWDGQDYVIIAGLDKMLEANDLPKSLNGADTWWARDPGESLSFPEATLIMPGGHQEELVSDDDQERIKYKSEGFVESDIVAADQIFPGTADKIREALSDRERASIPIDSTQGQHIMANIVRDALIAREIAVTRGKQIENQYDDKYMPPKFNSKIRKMIQDLNMPIGLMLHADSEEAEIEREVSQGSYKFYADDPKVRRTAYASGFTHGGGTARQESIRQRTIRRMPGA